MPPRNRRWKPLSSAYPDRFSSSYNDQRFPATDSRFSSAPSQAAPPKPTGPPYVPTLLESHESLKQEIDNEVYTSLRNLRGVKLAEAAISFDLHLEPERLYESVKDGVPLIAKRDGLSSVEKEVIGLKLELNLVKDKLAKAQEELTKANKYIAAANQEVAGHSAERRALLEEQKELQTLLCRQRQRRAPLTTTDVPAVQVAPRLRKLMSSSLSKSSFLNEDIKVTLPPTNILPRAVHATTRAHGVGPVTKTNNVSSLSLLQVPNGDTSQGVIGRPPHAIRGLSHELFLANSHGSGAAPRNHRVTATGKSVAWSAGNMAVPSFKSNGTYKSSGTIQAAAPTPMGSAFPSQPNLVIPVPHPSEATSSALAAPLDAPTTPFSSTPTADGVPGNEAAKMPETTDAKTTDNTTKHRTSTRSTWKTPLQPISDRSNSQQAPTTGTFDNHISECHPLPPKPAVATSAQPTHSHSSADPPEPHRPHISNSAIGAIQKHLESGNVTKSRSTRGRGKGKGGRRTKATVLPSPHEARDVVKTDV